MECEDLTKLTVPALKALCKARKIVGYSKLNKAGLLEKLGIEAARAEARPSASTPQDNHTGTATSAPGSSPEGAQGGNGLSRSESTVEETPPPTVVAVTVSPRRLPANSSNETARQEPSFPSKHVGLVLTDAGLGLTSLNLRPGTTSREPSEAPGNSINILALAPSHAKEQSKRSRPDAEAANPARQTKRAKFVPDDIVRSMNLNKSNATGNARVPPPSPHRTLTSALVPLPQLANRLSNRSQDTSPGTSPGQTNAARSKLKRFRGLVPKKATAPTSMAAYGQVGANWILTQAANAAGSEVPTTWTSAWIIPASHLEFSSPKPPPSLERLTLPPKIAQRKHVGKLSLLFSLLDDDCLRILSQCSKLYRYSAYSAATERLRRQFTGARLASIVGNFSSTLNYWPYLRQREDERQYRRQLYEESFLGQAFNAFPNIISSRLHTSPDDPQQFTIAIRFLTTLFYFHVSIGFDRRAQFLRKSIETVEQIVPGEIWKVGMCSDSWGREAYYVLESTCEVVGIEAGSKDGNSDNDAPAHPLRADWTAYISKKKSDLADGEISVQKSLFQSLRWPNHEEYTHGISKVWISRVENEGEIGKYKLVVAKRYVLACVVGNSVSGRAMTSAEMEGQFKGNAVTKALPAARRRAVELPTLYLPECHLVESVHFKTSKGLGLHPALATVQTPSREYFILKDNGMQVGCEEEGIPSVWQQIFQCNAQGVAVTVSR
ncbi:hypothetical protein BKA70DRAFT_1264196 [Coprinopsis sp. MPI-PUGE-AT-0042]|nr:hypothetical protein BKA70DRAFT_1264196 [Coprinopsis sp. MPI-PUGE-AT-0042]